MIETEIEFKNLITYEEFQAIKHSFFVNVKPFHQTNFYIDTKDLAIRKNMLMLRIRKLQNQFVLTLKVPNEQYVITEYHHILDDDVIEQAKIDASDLSTDIINILKNKGIDITSLSIQGSLDTTRYERTYKGGTLVLDESHYFSVTDYELEYEAMSVNNGKVIFNEILDRFDIKRTKEIVKSERFYQELMERT